MTTYTWPAAIQPQSCTLLLEPNIREWISPYSGAHDAVDLMGERWRLVLALPPRFRSQGGAVEALFNKLRGVHKLSLPYFARPVPAGTLRGSPLLNAAVAQGASTLVLKSVRSIANLLTYSRAFDGAGWGSVNGGTVTPDTATAPDGSATADTLTDSNGTSNAGRRQTIAIADDTASYTGSVYLLKTTGGTSKTVQVQVVLVNGSTVTSAIRIDTDAGAILSGTGTIEDAATDWWRVSMTATNNASGNTQARLDVFPAVDVHGGSGNVGATTGSCSAWGAQLEVGSSASAFAPATLLAGDLLGLGGQWLQVADDATEAADGTLTVTLANRVRVAASLGDAVAWASPECTFRLASPGVPVTHAPGVTEGLQVELIEAW